MNCKFINVLAFTTGAILGSVVTWKIVSDRYEKLVQAEIESIKTAFSEHPPACQEQDSEQEDEEEDASGTSRQINWSELEDLDDEDTEYEPDYEMREYANLVSNYTSEEGGAIKVTKAPYVIAPYDYGELDGYHTVELTYYMDNILEDDEYNIITDAEELIGRDSLNTFGEYEDDAVFVRNEHLRTDFQILKYYRTYDEAKSVGPARVDDE